MFNSHNYGPHYQWCSPLEVSAPPSASAQLFRQCRGEKPDKINTGWGVSQPTRHWILLLIKYDDTSSSSQILQYTWPATAEINSCCHFCSSKSSHKVSVPHSLFGWLSLPCTTCHHSKLSVNRIFTDKLIHSCNHNTNNTFSVKIQAKKLLIQEGRITQNYSSQPQSKSLSGFDLLV